MKSNNENKSNIQNFIDKLIFPPSITNSFRKSNSVKKNPQHNTNNQNDLFSTKQHMILVTPMKSKSKSQDKDSKIFSNSKSYLDTISNENSIVVSRMSEFDEVPQMVYVQKSVKFRENLIKRNSRHKRQNSSKQARTPSIIKKSKQIRMNSNQLINASPIKEHTNSQSNLMFEDRQARAARTNEVVQKRYLTILERFNGKYSHRIKKQISLRTDEKYKDQLFPPIQSSVYRGGNVKLHQKNDILKWYRLSDIFKDKRIVVVSQEPSNIEIISNNFFNQNPFMQTAFNCIKNCKFLLQRIFQKRQQNQFGIYLVKIFQQNVWKYVIIDDYIPTIQTQNGDIIPAFITIQQFYERSQIQIWPFLLEKAYANYYANYESLHYGNTLDFLEEVSGMSGEVFQYTTNIKKLTANNDRLLNYFDQKNIFYLGFRQPQNLYIPISKKQNNHLYITIQQQQIQLTIQNIFEQLDKIYIFNCDLFVRTNVSTIGMNIKKNIVMIPRFDISVRILKMSEKGLVSITLRQKQRRFYQKSTLNYNYMWVRVLIFEKQLNGDCRWIDGKYSNTKSINIFKHLDAGQYYILILPQWKSSYCYELSMMINSNLQLSLFRKDYDENDKLIVKGCTDLAQRYGKLYQINPFACSYSYKHEELGLLIQNINNQRYSGQIRINRSISGLKANVQLVPFNIQFYQTKNSKLPYKTQISINIIADMYYTVILMMRGGLDNQFMKRFDFGK